MNSRIAASRRPQQPKRHTVRTASVMAAAVSSALLASAGAGEAMAAIDARSAAPGLAERVISLRHVLAERDASAGSKGEWVDRVLSPKLELSQEKKWNKWNNG